MKRLPATTLFCIFLISLNMTYAQSKAVDYLGIKKPLSFQNKNYGLVWSSHPTALYYKHEYLQTGETLAKFQTMILLEVLKGATKLSDVVSMKVNELKTMQKTNPLVQYEVFNNAKTGEYLLDFLVTANDAQGNPAIAERNVYRYKTVTNKEGKTDILLFGVSKRSYDQEITSFLKDLKQNKKLLVNEVAQYSLPQIQY